MNGDDEYPLPNLNSVTLAGRVAKAPGLAYRKDGAPVLRFLVVVEDMNVKLNKTFSTTIPCELVGDQAERIGGELEADDTVLVRGRMAYRSTAESSSGSLGVWCQLVQKLNARSAHSAVS